MACVVPISAGGGETTVTCASGYQVYVCAFNSALEYIGYDNGCSRGWKSSPYTFDFEGAEYLYVVVRSSNNRTLTEDDIAAAPLDVSGGVAPWLTRM